MYSNTIIRLLKIGRVSFLIVCGDIIKKLSYNCYGMDFLEAHIFKSFNVEKL